MRTIAERQKMDRRFKRISKVGKWVYKHISKKLGTAIIDWNDNQWDMSY